MNSGTGYESPTTLDYIGGIPIAWFREIDAACDKFFASRGIIWNYGFGFREQNHNDAQAALAIKKGSNGLLRK